MNSGQSKEILVLGGVTHNNRGDLAMMEGLFAHLRQISPDVDPILYSWNPEVSRRIFKVECRPSPDPHISNQFAKRSSRLLAIFHIGWFLLRFALFHFVSYRAARVCTNSNLLAFFAQLSRSSAVVIHGSGSFNSYWWYDWVYPKTACAIAARISGKPVLLTSQGVGPFKNIFDKFVAAAFFRTATFLGVRDGSESADVMRKLGARSDHIWQTGDDALPLPELSSGEATALLAAEGLNSAEMMIGVNMRDASAYASSFSETGLDKIAISLTAIAERYRARLVFIPISYDSFDDDRKSAEKIASMIGTHVPITIVRNERSAAELRELISHFQICVGTSYHFLLFALNANVPSIGLFRNDYYRQKQTGLLGLFGQAEQCVDATEISVAELTERIDRLMAERASLSPAIKKVNSALAEKARNAHARFAQIINAKLANPI